MNDADDNDLGRRLRAIDRPRSFDADAFAKRVIAERLRRRKRRVAARCAVTLALAAIGVAWYWSRPVELQRMITESGIRARAEPKGTAESPPQQIDELDALLRQIEQQQREWERLEQLADRLARSEAALAAARKKRQEQQLAFIRAELSAQVKVPDLTRLYVDQRDDASRENQQL